MVTGERREDCFLTGNSLSYCYISTYVGFNVYKKKNFKACRKNLLREFKVQYIRLCFTLSLKNNLSSGFIVNGHKELFLAFFDMIFFA
jgi:hypothetical protein